MAAMTPEQRAADKAKKYAYQRAYVERNREMVRKKYKDNYARQRELKKAKAAEARQRMRDNPELRARYNAAVKARLSANGGAKRRAASLQQRLWRAKNAERVKAKQAAYYRKHRERYYVAVRARKALKKAAAVNLRGMRAFVKAIKSKPFATCYYCQARTPTADVHFDHIVALSKGGAHSVENLCVSCSACNLSKGAKPLAEWTREAVTQQLLPL